MRILILESCFWIIRKLKGSCIIGFNCVGGTIQGKNPDVYYFDDDFNNVEVIDINGDELIIPNKQPFHIVRTLK